MRVTDMAKARIPKVGNVWRQRLPERTWESSGRQRGNPTGTWRTLNYRAATPGHPYVTAPVDEWLAERLQQRWAA
jgi:hypothetical protein